MFVNTLDLVRECNITMLHVFPYSPRPGTPAAKMPQVPVKARKERAARLRELGDELLENQLKSYINKEIEIIVEEEKTGRSTHFFKVDLNRRSEPGKIISVRVVDVGEGCLKEG